MCGAIEFPSPEVCDRRVCSAFIEHTARNLASNDVQHLNIKSSGIQSSESPSKRRANNFPRSVRVRISTPADASITNAAMRCEFYVNRAVFSQCQFHKFAECHELAVCRTTRESHVQFRAESDLSLQFDPWHQHYCPSSAYAR